MDDGRGAAGGWFGFGKLEVTAAWVMLTIAVYVFNGVSDLAGDRLNGSARPLASGRLPLTAALTSCGLLAAGSLAFCFTRGVLLGTAAVACSHHTSVTAGTMLDRTPLTVWSQAVWAFVTAKDGVSASGLKPTLPIGSHQTACAILHRLRPVLIRPGRERLGETYIGGEETGLAGGRARGKKALVLVAVESVGAHPFGRARMQAIGDASVKTLHAFIADNVEPGTTVITDGWTGYRGLDTARYTQSPATRPPPRRRDRTSAACCAAYTGPRR